MVYFRRYFTPGGTYFFNPVKHGYVSSAKERPYSSFHRYVQNAVLQENWDIMVAKENLENK